MRTLNSLSRHKLKIIQSNAKIIHIPSYFIIPSRFESKYVYEGWENDEIFIIVCQRFLFCPVFVLFRIFLTSNKMWQLRIYTVKCVIQIILCVFQSPCFYENVFRDKLNGAVAACDCNATVFGSIPTRREWNYYLLIFSFLRSGTKSSVKLRHSTRNVSKIKWKVEYRVL